MMAVNYTLVIMILFLIRYLCKMNKPKKQIVNEDANTNIVTINIYEPNKKP